MRRERAFFAVVAVLTLMILVNAARLGYGYYNDDPASAGAATDPNDGFNTPSGSSGSTSSAEPQPVKARLTLPKRPTVVVLGDGYAAGDGGDPRLGYVSRTATALDWNASIIPGGSGSGYVTKGESGTLDDRLKRARARDDVDLVIIAAGTADANSNGALEDFEPAVREVLDDVKRVFPGAQELLIGPIYANPPGNAAVLVEAGIGQASTEAHVPYISPVILRWLGVQPEAYLNGDTQLTEDGQARVAAQLQRSLDMLVQAGTGAS